jgi:hypothetical protein
MNKTTTLITCTMKDGSTKQVMCDDDPAEIYVEFTKGVENGDWLSFSLVTLHHHAMLEDL